MLYQLHDGNFPFNLKEGTEVNIFHNYSWMYNHVKCFYKHAFTYGTLHNTEFFFHSKHGLCMFS